MFSSKSHWSIALTSGIPLLPSILLRPMLLLSMDLYFHLCLYEAFLGQVVDLIFFSKFQWIASRASASLHVTKVKVIYFHTLDLSLDKW